MSRFLTHKSWPPRTHISARAIKLNKSLSIKKHNAVQHNSPEVPWKTRYFTHSQQVPPESYNSGGWGDYRGFPRRRNSPCQAERHTVLLVTKAGSAVEGQHPTKQEAIFLIS
ncbi:hypothetical protein NPIL_43661 [Nephila pilipes]|uniref:Uncharacterized protein n=1 Tax=Nephila pilipes TaxID=299642 RepID=A0A8X6TNH6_NEPPI|nr:hypothetical protein NPIL_43661 [Nephila pilipes]